MNVDQPFPVLTIGELELGVLSATDAESRARRGDTLALAKALEPVPISEADHGSLGSARGGLPRRRHRADCQAHRLPYRAR